MKKITQYGTRTKNTNKHVNLTLNSFPEYDRFLLNCFREIGFLCIFSGFGDSGCGNGVRRLFTTLGVLRAVSFRPNLMSKSGQISKVGIKYYQYKF
jgi:hypothetical protein